MSHRLEYDEFVKEFAKHLVQQFGDRVDTYITSAVQASLRRTFPFVGFLSRLLLDMDVKGYKEFVLNTSGV